MRKMYRAQYYLQQRYSMLPVSQRFGRSDIPLPQLHRSSIGHLPLATPGLVRGNLYTRLVTKVCLAEVVEHYLLNLCIALARRERPFPVYTAYWYIKPLATRRNRLR